MPECICPCVEGSRRFGCMGVSRRTSDRSLPNRGSKYARSRGDKGLPLLDTASAAASAGFLQAQFFFTIAVGAFAVRRSGWRAADGSDRPVRNNVIGNPVRFALERIVGGADARLGLDDRPAALRRRRRNCMLQGFSDQQPLCAR